MVLRRALVLPWPPFRAASGGLYASFMSLCRIPDRTLIVRRLDHRAAPKGRAAMLDVLYLAVAVGFFIAMSAYARAVSKG
ncbi:hypothetical protein ACO2RV_21860 [Ancylobacter sp. VNQ12]|uniref:hypothetical protein n=1 Tax=Ancylobacter sp. VNQ12 TaxID=3400920 RepID=UPI003C0B7892